jgi:hypothetical protein
MVTKILIPSILILVILFFIIKKKENFAVSSTLELSFNAKDSIFLVSNNMKYIEQSVQGTKIFKTDNLIYSNKEIFSESGEFSGFIFSVKPNQKIHIGFSNLTEDPKNKIAHGINIIDDGVLEIVEKVEGTKEYLIQDIDYCLSGGLDTCLRTKNKYTFNTNNNFLAIVLNNGIANYLLVKRNENGEYGSMLIHRGKNPIKLPYRLKVIANDFEVMVPNLLWTKHSYVYDSPVYWSVETSFKDDYDNKVLDVAPMPSQSIEVEETPAPTKSEDDFNFDGAFSTGVRKILITNIKTDGINYQMEYRHNLEYLYLELNKDRIFLKLYLDDDTYIFRKYPDLDSVNLFKNRQTVEAIELVIGDVISHKYAINESNKTDISLSPAPY